MSVLQKKRGGLPTRPMDESFIRSCDLCFHFVVASCGKMGKLKTADSCGTLAMSCVLRWRAALFFFSFSSNKIESHLQKTKNKAMKQNNKTDSH